MPAKRTNDPKEGLFTMCRLCCRNFPDTFGFCGVCYGENRVTRPKEDWCSAPVEGQEDRIRQHAERIAGELERMGAA